MSVSPISANIQQKRDNSIYYHPRYFYDVLDKYVVGQESAKKSLSVILHQHRIRRQKNLTNAKKTNCLLIGPSGCGKSLMINTMAQVLGVPCVSVSATSIVQRGYYGGLHVGEIFGKLKAKSNEQETKYGIVMIDEIDKLAHFNKGEGIVDSIGVQRELLSVIDGHSAMPSYFNEEWEHGRSFDSFDTSNVLFIFAGAFHEITKYSYFSNEVTHSDLVKFGLMPEFVNRLGTIIPFNGLTDDQLKKIIEKEVDEYNHYLQISPQEKAVHVELILSGINANENNAMGARAIQNAIQQFYEEKIFNAPFDHQLQQIQSILNVFGGTIEHVK
jgi:ATP-dependent Clp protease ATP-binding subunit ClpX